MPNSISLHAKAYRMTCQVACPCPGMILCMPRHKPWHRGIVLGMTRNRPWHSKVFSRGLARQDKEHVSANRDSMAGDRAIRGTEAKQRTFKRASVWRVLWSRKPSKTCVGRSRGRSASRLCGRKICDFWEFPKEAGEPTEDHGVQPRMRPSTRGGFPWALFGAIIDSYLCFLSIRSAVNFPASFVLELFLVLWSHH